MPTCLPEKIASQTIYSVSKSETIVHAYALQQCKCLSNSNTHEFNSHFLVALLCFAVKLHLAWRGKSHTHTQAEILLRWIVLHVFHV